MRKYITLLMLSVLGISAYAQLPDASFLVYDNVSDVLAEALVDTVVIRNSPANTPLEDFEQPEEKNVFIPKGQMVVGFNVSYSQSNQNKYQFLIVENLSGDTYSFKISPMFCYVFKDDMGAGGRIAYSRNLTKLEKADFVLDAETNYGVDHLYRLEHNYYGTAMFRNYFALGKSKRIGIFNECQLQVGGGQTKFMTGIGQELSGNYETSVQLNVGIAPGLVYFLSNYSAIEVNVGVLGFSYKSTKTITDQIYFAKRNLKSANFRINLFSISFGVAWYI